MRAIQAIVVGLLMVWMQAVASVSPHFVEQTAACRCCKCGQAACATQNTVPAPTSSPVAANASMVEKEKSSAPTRVAQAQPRPFEAASVTQAPANACPLPSLPLFRRHCALLI